MPLTITFIGNHAPPHSTESDLRHTLEGMGHRVHSFQENARGSSWSEILPVALKSDMLLWVKTWSSLEAGGLAALRQLKEAGIPTAAIHLDLYHGLNRETRLRTDPWFKCEFVFTADGGSDDKWPQFGINHFWLPPGILESSCYLGAQDPKYTHDVVFVGSQGYHPEWPHRTDLIRFLRKNFGKRLGKYGNPERTMRGDDLNRLYNSSKVVIGDTLCLDGHRSYTSDRLTESLGRAAFLIYPHIEGLESLGYEEGVHYIPYTYHDFAGLKKLIEHWLKPEQDEARERIRMAGFQRTKECNTYRHRMLEVFDILGETYPKFQEHVA